MDGGAILSVLKYYYDTMSTQHSPNSPSTESAGVGKAAIWLNPIKDTRRKRPWHVDAILKENPISSRR
jgi:hypothetical protein